MSPAEQIIADIDYLISIDPEFARDWECADIGIDYVLNACSNLGDISAQYFIQEFCGV